MKTIASFYNEKSAPNSTVSMLGSVVCKRCYSKGYGIFSDDKKSLPQKYSFKKCSCKDGLLTSQIPFSSQLLECAISPTFATEIFGGWAQAKGQVIRVSYSSYSFGIPKKYDDVYKTVTIRITDLMKDGLCRCGHQRSDHRNTILPNMPGEECTNGQDELIKCSCEKYEPRGIDLTEKAFSLLAPLSTGIIEVEVEKI